MDVGLEGLRVCVHHPGIAAISKDLHPVLPGALNLVNV